MLADAFALADARGSAVALILDAARMLNDLWALGGFGAQINGKLDKFWRGAFKALWATSAWLLRAHQCCNAEDASNYCSNTKLQGVKNGTVSLS